MNVLIVSSPLYLGENTSDEEVSQDAFFTGNALQY